MFEKSDGGGWLSLPPSLPYTVDDKDRIITMIIIVQTRIEFLIILAMKNWLFVIYPILLMLFFLFNMEYLTDHYTNI
jgi:hypothetical protein